MQTISPSRNRFWQVITVCLTVVGILLFIYGSRIAASQSDDKEYVEGIKRQQLLSASALAMLHTGNPMQQDALADSAIVINKTASAEHKEKPGPDAVSKSAGKGRENKAAKPMPGDKQAGASSKHGRQDRHRLGPSGQQSAAN